MSTALKRLMGDTKATSCHAQRRRRVKKLAQRGSAGKRFKTNASPSGAAQNPVVLAP